MNFWDNHSIWFLISLLVFPRITMLAATSVGGGWLYWVGFATFPRMTAQYYGFVLYHDTNPVLTFIAPIVGFVVDVFELEVFMRWAETPTPKISKDEEPLAGPQ